MDSKLNSQKEGYVYNNLKVKKFLKGEFMVTNSRMTYWEMVSWHKIAFKGKSKGRKWWLLED